MRYAILILALLAGCSIEAQPKLAAKPITYLEACQIVKEEQSQLADCAKKRDEIIQVILNNARSPQRAQLDAALDRCEEDFQRQQKRLDAAISKRESLR